jgi:hypothetical protein
MRERRKLRLRRQENGPFCIRAICESDIMATVHPQADFIAGIHADGADQFLISYLTLTRFPQSSPYSLGFALGHCFELSLKAIYWSVKGTLPNTHALDELTTNIGSDLEREMDTILPDRNTVRNRFKDIVKPMMEGPLSEQFKTYFEFIPTGNDDAWLMLFILYILADVKYGVDKKQRVLQLMQTTPPRLNSMALRAIGCARRHFPRPDFHRIEIEKFVRANTVKAPIKGLTMSRIERWLAADERRKELQRRRLDNELTPDDAKLLAEIRLRKILRLRKRQTEEPKTSLVFTLQELRLISDALGLALPPDLQGDDA